MTATVSVIAPKGGQGATTVAATLALLAAADGSQRVLFVSDDATAILGDPRGRTEPWDVGDDHRQLVAATSRPPHWNGDVQIIDGPATGADSTVLVVRNCYLAVCKAAAAAWEEQRADHIVVIRQPGRAITPRDIAAALALPAGAITTIDADPAVARRVDAGLLAQSSLPRSLEPLRALSLNPPRRPHRWIEAQSRRGPAPAWHPHPGHRPARARRVGPRRRPHPRAARNRRSAAVTTPSPVIPPPQPSDHDVDLNSIVAYNFRAARTLRGWTQKEAGRRLEPLLRRRVPQVHVAQLEGAYRGRRRREFDAHELLAFAIAFQLPVVWFLLPPPGDNRRLRNTQAYVHDLYEIVFGRPDHLEPLYQRLRHFAHSDPDAAESAVDQIAGPGLTAQLPAYRQRRTEMVLALLDSRADQLERAAGEIGAFFDHVRRLGLRSLIAQAEGTTDE